MSKYIQKISFIFFFVFLCHYAFSDIVYLKNGENIKGIVVEDYKDRVILSTYNGEKAISKNDILRIEYDLLEQNLINIGDIYKERDELDKAYFYYSKAYAINPKNKDVKERLFYIHGYAFRRQQERKAMDVQRRQELENWPRGGQEKQPVEGKLYETVGIGFETKGRYVSITKVRKNSPAYKAGIKAGDYIISIWGQLTGYMRKVEIANLLLEKSPGEIKMAVERELIIKAKSKPGLKNMIGLKLKMLWDGLTSVSVEDNSPAKLAGVIPGDLITAINGTPTRYIKLGNAKFLIEESIKQKNEVILTVRRNITLWVVE